MITTALQVVEQKRKSIKTKWNNAKQKKKSNRRKKENYFHQRKPLNYKLLRSKNKKKEKKIGVYRFFS